MFLFDKNIVDQPGLSYIDGQRDQNMPRDLFDFFDRICIDDLDIIDRGQRLSTDDITDHIINNLCG